MRKKVLLKGPLLTRSGYGEQSRFALRALRSRPDLFDIYIQPLQWGQTSWVAEMDKERIWIDKIIEKTVNFMHGGGRFDVSLQITIPNEWQNLAPVNIGYTAGIETTIVAPQWIVKGNEIDRIIVVSNHSKDVYKNSKFNAQDQTGKHVLLELTTPIEAVAYPVKTFETTELENFSLKNDFNFLCVAQHGPRKNLMNTINWFLEEFKDEEVGLVVKTNMAKNCLMDREMCYNNMTSLIRQHEDAKCAVYLLHGDMTDSEMHALYTHPQIGAYISLAHGEGFGLPLYEAAYSGVPVICPGWSGQLDFLVDEDGNKHFYDVGYDIAQIPDEVVWENVIIKESGWAVPREQSAKYQMRTCYRDNQSLDREDNKYKDYAQTLHERYSEEKQYQAFIDAFLGEKLTEISIEEVPKVSLVTSVFGAEDYIEQLMEDVTRQTIFEEKCEWVILNANPAGKDMEEEVILKYVEKYPNNIVYKRLEEDPGIYDTWNMAIQMATGEFVTNVNCDDRRPSWAYEQQAKMLVANPDVGLVYNDSYITHEPNVIWEDVPKDCQRYNFEQFSKEAMLRSNLPHNNPMWRRSLHDEFGYFNQYYKSAGDWDMWLRCAFGGVKFKKHPDILGVYYFNPTGMSTNPEHDSWKRVHEKEIFQTYLQAYQREQQTAATAK